MGSEYFIKVLAWLLGVVGGAAVIAGLLSLFGPVLVGFSAPVLLIGGGLLVLSGYGLMNRDLDEI